MGEERLQMLTTVQGTRLIVLLAEKSCWALYVTIQHPFSRTPVNESVIPHTSSPLLNKGLIQHWVHAWWWDKVAPGITNPIRGN